MNPAGPKKAAAATAAAVGPPADYQAGPNIAAAEQEAMKLDGPNEAAAEVPPENDEDGPSKAAAEQEAMNFDGPNEPAATAAAAAAADAEAGQNDEAGLAIQEDQAADLDTGGAATLSAGNRV